MSRTLRIGDRNRTAALALVAAIAATAFGGVTASLAAPPPADGELAVEVPLHEGRLHIELRELPGGVEPGAVLPQGAAALSLELPRQADEIGLRLVEVRLEHPRSPEPILWQEAPVVDGRLRVDLSGLPEPISGEDYAIRLAPANDIHPHAFNGYLSLSFTGPPEDEEPVLLAEAEGRDPLRTLRSSVARSWKLPPVTAPDGARLRIRGGHRALADFSDGEPPEEPARAHIVLGFESVHPELTVDGDDLLLTISQPAQPPGFPVELDLRSEAEIAPGERRPSVEYASLRIPLPDPAPDTGLGERVSPTATVPIVGEPEYGVRVKGRQVPMPARAVSAILHLPEELQRTGLRQIDANLTDPEGRQLWQQRLEFADGAVRLDFSTLAEPPEGAGYTLALAPGQDIAPHSFEGELQLDFTRPHSPHEQLIDAGRPGPQSGRERTVASDIGVAYRSEAVALRPGDTVLVREGYARIARYPDGQGPNNSALFPRLLRKDEGDAPSPSVHLNHDERDLLFTVPEGIEASKDYLLVAGGYQLYGNRDWTVRGSYSISLSVPLRLASDGETPGASEQPGPDPAPSEPGPDPAPSEPETTQPQPAQPGPTTGADGETTVNALAEPPVFDTMIRHEFLPGGGEKAVLPAASTALTLELPRQLAASGARSLTAMLWHGRSYLGKQTFPIENDSVRIELPDGGLTGENYNISLYAEERIAPHLFFADLRLDFTAPPSEHEPVIRAAAPGRETEATVRSTLSAEFTTERIAPEPGLRIRIRGGASALALDAEAAAASEEGPLAYLQSIGAPDWLEVPVLVEGEDLVVTLPQEYPENPYQIRVQNSVETNGDWGRASIEERTVFVGLLLPE
ncbi:MAG: hypothetical protein Q4E05_02940 [Pseudoclavibacter sp.]|nr:hypothetical protein [Pseudoclavibacter sp.]